MFIDDYANVIFLNSLLISMPEPGLVPQTVPL